jgi:hypothetical protein
LLPPVTLWEAIGDLPRLAAGEGEEEIEYDLLRRECQIDHYTGRYIIEVLEVDKTSSLTNHVARPHSQRDLRDFALLREGESSAVAMRVTYPTRSGLYPVPAQQSPFRKILDILMTPIAEKFTVGRGIQTCQTIR